MGLCPFGELSPLLWVRALLWIAIEVADGSSIGQNCRLLKLYRPKREDSVGREKLSPYFISLKFSFLLVRVAVLIDYCLTQNEFTHHNASSSNRWKQGLGIIKSPQRHCNIGNTEFKIPNFSSILPVIGLSLTVKWLSVVIKSASFRLHGA